MRKAFALAGVAAIGIGAAVLTVATSHAGTTKAATGKAAAAANLTIGTAVKAGSGCPQGDGSTVKVSGTTVTVTFKNLKATSGGSTPASGSRKNCQLSLSVTPARGYAVTISGAKFDVATKLTAGRSARQLTSYHYTSAASRTVTPAARTFTTAGSRTATVSHDAAALRSLGKSQCGKQDFVNVNTQALATASTAAINTITVSKATVTLAAVKC